jgi:hypothetical protein
VTEAEWHDCTDPKKMLEFLESSSRASERKLRLFAVACSRRVPEAATYRRARKALEVAEHYADGLAAPQELREAGEAAWKGARWTRSGTRSAAVAASQACSSPAETHSFLTCVNVLCSHAAAGFSEAARVALQEERAALAALLRDIFGPLPFRPVTIAPAVLAWDVGTVGRIAEGIYDERASDRLPVLADALEEAGCTDGDLLGHLRGPGPHARGCWAVDLLLGKG